MGENDSLCSPTPPEASDPPTRALFRWTFESQAGAGGDPRGSLVAARCGSAAGFRLGAAGVPRPDRCHYRRAHAHGAPVGGPAPRHAGGRRPGGWARATWNLVRCRPSLRSSSRVGMALDELRGRLKESLLERQALEEERRTWVAAVSHDLRTPLSVIRGYAEGLRDGVASTPEKQRALPPGDFGACSAAGTSGRRPVSMGALGLGTSRGCGCKPWTWPAELAAMPAPPWVGRPASLKCRGPLLRRNLPLRGVMPWR